MFMDNSFMASSTGYCKANITNTFKEIQISIVESIWIDPKFMIDITMTRLYRKYLIKYITFLATSEW